MSLTPATCLLGLFSGWRIGSGMIGAMMIEHLRGAWAELTAPGAGFAMSEAIIDGVPMRVFDTAPPTMRSVWEQATLRGDTPYVVYEDESFTYAEIAASIRRLAHVLHHGHGVGRGDRVAIAMRNYPEWVIGYWAVTALGAAVVGLNAWWTTPEMAFALRDSRPKVLIADEERVSRVIPVLEDLVAKAPLDVIAVRTPGDLPAGIHRWDEVVATAADLGALPDVTIDPGDVATIFYTSGTTGTPKGAMLTHRSSVHNVLHVIFWALVNGQAERRAVAAGDLPEPVAGPAAPEQFAFMAPTPLFHVTACNCVLHPCTMAGARIVLMRKWDPGRALELIERERVTHLSGVPSMSRELLAHPDWDTRDTSSLRNLGGGGAPIQPDLVGKIGRSLRGGAPTTGYGLTETSGIVTANSSRLYLAKPASCGPVMPTLDAKLVDDTGRDLAPGADTIGQLCVRGPAVVPGYWERPAETAEAIRNGWFNTGDIARIDDDGFVFIVDRAKDMVIRGGENVYCAEVEAAIHEHDDVAEAVVFGVADERLGEAVAAVVVPRAGTDLDEAGLLAHLRGRIASHKIPTTWWLRNEPLPRNANGKFLKRELRRELTEH